MEEALEMNLCRHIFSWFRVDSVIESLPACFTEQHHLSLPMPVSAVVSCCLPEVLWELHSYYMNATECWLSRPDIHCMHRLPVCASGAGECGEDAELMPKRCSGLLMAELCLIVGGENALRALLPVCLIRNLNTWNIAEALSSLTSMYWKALLSLFFLLLIGRRRKLSLFVWDFSLQTGLDMNLYSHGIFCGLCYFRFLLCFSALWYEDAMFIKKALVSFKYHAFLNWSQSALTLWDFKIALFQFLRIFEILKMFLRGLGHEKNFPGLVVLRKQ